MDDIREQLYSRTKKKEGPLPTLCVIWTGAHAKGYGQIKWNGKTYGTHRLAWELEHGSIPKGWCICHHCDERACIEVDHLWLDTYQANNDDMARKGRRVIVAGEGNGQSRLTERQAGEVKWLALEGRLSQSAIGARYGVVRGTVRDIKSGRIWSRVEPIEPAPIARSAPNVRRV
jgi:HNH endonuclease